MAVLPLAKTEDILKNIQEVKAVLIGDLCLDVYWSCDMTRSHLSRETAHFPLPVMEERTSAGGGANAAACMEKLEPKQFTLLGACGKDWRGDVLLGILNRLPHMDASHVVVSETYRTNAYCKPMRYGYSGVETEDPRLDFENYEALPQADEERLLAALNKAVKDADILVVSDQLAYGCITEKIRARINEIAETRVVIIDSRSRIGLYKHCFLKPNEIECARALSMDEATLKEGATEDVIKSAAKALYEKCDARGVFLTLGSRGSLFFDGSSYTKVSAVKVAPPVDIVGAGDCFLSALSLALASGADAESAMTFGSMASSICVKKLGTTGTASPDELKNIK